MKKITVQAFKKSNFSGEEIQEANNSNLHLKESYVFSASRAVSEVHKLDLKDDDVLEFVFADNTSWIGSPDIVHDIFPKETREQKAKRGADDDGSFKIPMAIKTDEASRSLLGDIALKALNVFVKKEVSKKVIEIAARLEKKALENKSGIYAVAPDFSLGNTTLKEGELYLLFLHGTNSSTIGSFGELIGTELWKSIQATYGKNIIALQHETMTKSPIQNVIAIFEKLPNTCTLHVISHSRGGLVGDVLARFCQGGKGFTADEIAYLTKAKTRENKIRKDVADIKALQLVAAKKTITLQKFIRVACPAYGTTILSKRLDHFLNISLNLLGALSGPVGSTLTAEFKELITAAVDTKNDPDELPGLEAMNPESPFLKILNNPENIIENPLTVIAGNCGIKFNLKALLIIASKLFYLRDNDLVVDTKSMYCGTKRKNTGYYFFDEGPEVDHVHYFKNKKTQDALLLALKATQDFIPNFSMLNDAMKRSVGRNAILGLDGGAVYCDKVTGEKPIAILLPGIMGSNLNAADKKVWINYWRFLAGDLSRLDISKKNISASSLIETSYKKIVDYLKAEYDVVTFPFDWRMPLGEAAELLEARVKQYLVFNQPIKIIGHSMGGVVARDFIINHPATFKKLNASKGFKMLLLGAPLGGSYRIPYVLAGKDSIINQISKIDLKHTKKELLDMFRRFPGLLALLPIEKAKDDFANINIWKKMKAASLFDWNIPDPNDLADWDKYRNNVLAKTASIEWNNVVYIAGKDDATVCGFEINNELPDEKIIFKSTAEGDQSVTWDTGIPKQLTDANRVYFVNVSHGALANNDGMFKGIAEILKNGNTDAFSRTRPSLRSAAEPGKADIFDTVQEEVYDTDALSLEKTILGLQEKKVAEKPGTGVLRVSVSHGDLFYSSYPVMVGHFKNDGITSAEKVIDGYTGYQLSQLHKLNIYPGQIGTQELFINCNNGFNGTLVIGLGEPGRLSAYELIQSTEQGAIKYILALAGNNIPDKKNAETGIAALLIGCGYGGLSIESSIRSIILGVQNANKKIEALNARGLKPITHIEFVELYQDRCLQSLYILSKMEQQQDSIINIRLPKKQIKKLLGSRTRIPMETETDWWGRITVQVGKKQTEGETEAEDILRFALNTGRAREEQRELLTTPEIIDGMVEEMSTDDNWDAGNAKTLFELLIPNDFKDEIKRQNNNLWILDSTAAAYPWELLQDSVENAKPLCYNAGMIRQLKLEDYRQGPQPATGKKALVIGDPDLDGFPFARQLDGAYAEATEVAFVLNKYGYEMPNNCFRKSSAQIINALFKDEYKIIHLAGHGLFNPQKPKSSGMLIGNNVFLSTRQIYQMSKVPELVFVNCCFLGKMDEGGTTLLNKRPYNLAANIGTELIKNGVKVVIAAGWAVDDAAALHFTNVFYSHMLDGYNFGDSVKAARKAVFDNPSFKHTNTWGAYQCYGDPFYKLSTYKGVSVPLSYLIAQEAEIDLSNLINSSDTKNSSAKQMMEKITAVVEAVKNCGINKNASITENEAMAYAECNEYEKAVETLQTLLGMEQADFSVKALEKYCNLRAKLCVKKWKEGKGRTKSLQHEEINAVIGDLQKLISMRGTAERLSIMGSTYKRKALITTDSAKKIEALMESAKNYKKAYELKTNSNKTYALSNWLEIEKILFLVKENANANSKVKANQKIKLILKNYTFADPKKIKNDIAAAITQLVNAELDMDFWNEIAIANAKLCAWLLEGEDTKELTADDVINAYCYVWNIAGSQNKKVSEIEHFDFLIDAYSGLVKKTATVKAIEKIRLDLENIIK